MAVPVLTTLPVVTGVPEIGDVLSCGSGSWTNTPTSYTYQWLANGVAISGATSATFTLLAAQNGDTISVAVVAVNGSGNSLVATTRQTAPVGTLSNITTSLQALITDATNAITAISSQTLTDDAVTPYITAAFTDLEGAQSNLAAYMQTLEVIPTATIDTAADESTPTVSD